MKGGEKAALKAISLEEAKSTYPGQYYTVSGKKGGILLPEKDHDQICWPLVTFEDFKTVLDKGWARTNVTIPSLQKYREYAVSVDDTKSLPEIDRTINELVNKSNDITVAEWGEVESYINEMRTKRGVGKVTC